MNLRKRIDELLEDYECYRAVSDAVGIDGCYLHHLRNGTKTNPSNETCTRLGLRKRMIIEYTLL